MVANVPRRDHEEAIDELKTAAKGLHQMREAIRHSLPTCAELLDSWREKGIMDSDKLIIGLHHYVVLARQVRGKDNRDLQLKISAAPISDLVELISALNTPDIWPIGRPVLVQLDEGGELHAARIVEYSNHFDWQEAAYPIYCRLTVRIEQ